MMETAQSEGQVVQEKELFKWMAHARPFRPLSRQVFTTAVAICALVAIILAFAGEWVLIAVMAAAVFAYYAWSTVPPERAEYTITTRGLRVHGQMYRWEDLARWWMEGGMLVVDAPATWPKRLHLVVGEGNEAGITEAMGKYLLMEKPEATPLDRAGKWVAEKFPLEAR